MTNNIAKIRAALEWGEGQVFVEALAALAELERAAAEPVAYQYAHPYFGGGKIWREEQRWNGHTSDEARALYAALPTPVAEIREPTDDECRDIWREAKANEGDGSKVYSGRAMFDAVRAVMWPKEGL